MTFELWCQLALTACLTKHHRLHLLSMTQHLQWLQRGYLYALTRFALSLGIYHYHFPSKCNECNHVNISTISL